jgi:hypothetical protein
LKYKTHSGATVVKYTYHYTHGKEIAVANESKNRTMAKEMAEFTKNNILNQAAQAMLAQANNLPQGVLQLLK